MSLLKGLVPNLVIVGESTSTSMEEAARNILKKHGYDVLKISRMPTGLCHYVYEAECTGITVVIRVASNETANQMRGGIYWHSRLKRLGLPVPDMHHSSGESDTPYMILTRLPGRDLGIELGGMSESELDVIASEIAAIQKRVSALPLASGYGWATSYDDTAMVTSWSQVIEGSISRSSTRVEHSGIGTMGWDDALHARMTMLDDYLRNVPRAAFLDDITTKNVIVANGSLSGIVDTDNVCFGDNLLTIALTRVALRSAGLGEYYTDRWLQYAQITQTGRAAFEFYTALFAYDFLSEMGQRFNRDTPEPVDEKRTRLLKSIFDDALATFDTY